MTTQAPKARAPRTKSQIRKVIADIWAEVLGVDALADDRTFFEAGGTSLLLMRARARMQDALGIEIAQTQLFETPRLKDLAKALAKQVQALGPVEEAAVEVAPEPAETGAIAIIGYAARLPGVSSTDEFWQAICNGDDLIERFVPSDLEDTLGDDIRSDPAFVAARSVLSDVDMFDAKYFGILPAEAAQMDPQGRVFLEICAQALDHAAVDPARAKGPIGVYAGATHSTYLLNNVMGDRGALEGFTSGFQLDNYNTYTGNITDTLATRVAFKLNLKGPAMSVSTTCSTSLTAIAQAVTALRAGQCDVALAGGVSITFPQKRGYVAKEGGMASQDGTVRPFDAQAQGTVFGHGAGVVVLKPLALAQADGDRIVGVIKGVGINNDGSDKIAFTAPSVGGQVGAIKAAYRDAALDPGTVSYVECHGTATPLGDPIEVRALSQAFEGVDGQGRVALGSVKGNIGHLDAGAGVVGVIKLVEMFQARQIPPVAHYKAPNPRISFEYGPFFVPEGLCDWSPDGPRRAGISGFGVGGTNVHLVLEEAPEVVAEAEEADEMQILPLSAKSAEALGVAAAELAEAMEAGVALEDAALTLQDGRMEHGFRMAVAAQSARGAAEALRASPAIRRAADAPSVAMLFPGQGAQYPGMCAGFYGSDPEVTKWLDRGAEVLGSDLRDLLTTADPRDEGAAEKLRQTSLAQPALFLTSYAIAQSWAAKGITPTAFIGHSVGEFAAAAFAGVMPFDTALALVAKRGALMQAQAPGVMVSVRASLDEVLPLLEDVDLAGANAPKLQVVSGSEDAIARLEARLEVAGIACRRLHTSHAFHSAMMDPVIADLDKALSKVTLNAPEIPLVSAVTGDWMTDAQATDPAIWAAQARAPVMFAKALGTLVEADAPVMMEAGPGKTLATFSAQTLKRDQHSGIVTTLPGIDAAGTAPLTTAQAAGALWCAGVPLEWARMSKRGARKVVLPGPVFLKKRHWIDPVPSQIASPTQAQLASPAAPMELPVMSQAAPVSAPRIERLQTEVTALFAELSGEDLSAQDLDVPFLELGFDSLFMGQAAQAIAKQFGVQMTFRSLLSEHPNLGALARHLDGAMPADVVDAVVPTPVPTLAPTPVLAPVAAPAPMTIPTATPIAASGDTSAILQAQMQTMQAVFAQQLQALGGQGVPAPAAAPMPAPTPVKTELPKALKTPEPSDKPKEFKFGRGPNLSGADVTEGQIAFAQNLARDYSAKYPSSKAHTQDYRAAHADPRSVAGFRPEWKELAFPIVAAKSKGAYIEDLDGNELLDLVNGFGQTAFGHAPDFVAEAVKKQLDTGYALGPQADRAGPVAKRLTEMLGHERVTFCNTGSEAVMAAMRLARAVTGRERIVVFSDDYHGQFDEVLVKGKARPGGDPKALPIAPGIPRGAVSNMVVLDYGPEASLEWIKEHGDEIAAVVVEPVQSRNPHHRPEEFVRELRKITKDAGSALVIDEVVTGFRTHKRGMQGVWDIQPDMATYGKVIGGGMPIGLLAGDAKFMDALDGGMWEFGDDSAPQVAPTFFAGTFVRHPLVVAAVDAVIDFMEAEGDRLWVGAADKAAGLAGRMNAALVARGLPELVKTYSSWFVLKTTAHDPRATLLYPLMRLQGVHLLDGFCGFLTTEHTDADCDRVLAAFEGALDRLQEVGILAPEGPVSLPAPRVAEVSAPVALTESQREIWMVHQLGDVPATAFNESVSLRISGALEAGKLTEALSQVMARHDALRSKFARDGATFTVQPAGPFRLDHMDVSTSADPEAALANLLAADARVPLDLVAGPPVRGTLVKMGADTHVLLMTAHHIVCDGWSFNTVVEDLSALYSAKVSGTEANLAPAPSFAQFARADHNVDAETAAYWRGVMADLPALPELPTDRPRQIQRSFNGATAATTIPADRVAKLKKAGGKMGATLFATLLAGVQMTLGRLSGSGQVVVCVPMGGQAHLEDQTLVGHLVNFLPIRADFDAAEPASAQVGRVAKAVMDGFDHGNYTLGTLVKDLDVPRQLGRLPISEVQFNLERVPEGITMGDATAHMKGNPKAGVNYDLFFNCVEGADGVRIEVDYNVDLYDETTIKRWVRHIDTLLGAMADAPETAIGALPLLTRDEQVALAAARNDTEVAYDRSARIEALVAAQVARTPDAVAVSGVDGALSYAEVAEQSDALAALIQDAAGMEPTRIGVAIPRGTGLLVSLLAVLKAGHAYVPLDPAQPLARQRNVLEAAEASAVISLSEDGAALTEGLDLSHIDPMQYVPGRMPVPHNRGAEDAAYVIFTSGSTGAPKGVEVPHRAVANFLSSMAAKPGMTASDKLLSVTTVSFDIAVLELFLPLTVGAQVEIASREDILDGFKLAARAGEGDITMMQATPTLWAMLLEAGLTPGAGLKVLAGGEPVPEDLAARLLANGAEVWNMYGPTETTIWSSVAKLEADQAVSIGDPIANTSMHVLDGNDGLCAPGVVGELNIGGDGLALGYYGRDDLTEAAFREVDVAGQTLRLYKTGDLAMRFADGGLKLLGRSDGQIKLRGYRIELGEIEVQLRAHPSVAAAAVALRKGPSGADQLVGYLVAEEGGAVDTNAVADHLASVLPDYMVPTAWKVMEALPHTANGKLDRKALPEPSVAETVRLRAVEAPKGETEVQIAAIWAEVLGRDVVSVTDTLQQLGADSLDIFRIASRLMGAGLPLEARDVFAHPSIRALAAHAATGASAPKRPSLKDFVRTRQTG